MEGCGFCRGRLRSRRVAEKGKISREKKNAENFAPNQFEVVNCETSAAQRRGSKKI